MFVPSEAVNVRSPIVLRRLLLSAAFWGVLLGATQAVIVAMIKPVAFWALMWYKLGHIFVWLLVWGIILGAMFTLSIMLCRRCHRSRLVFIVSFTFGALFSLTGDLFAWALEPMPYASLFRFCLHLAISLLAGIAAGILGLIVLGVVRWVCGAVVEQDGSLCPTCGYKLGAGRCCPECGTMADNTSIRPQRRKFRMRDAARLVVVLIALAYPTSRILFVDISTPVDGAKFSAGIFDLKSSPAGITLVQVWQGHATYYTMPNSVDRGLIIASPNEYDDGKPYLQLQLVVVAGDSWGYGDPMLVCNISKQDSKRLKEDSYSEILSAMIELSDTYNWQPSLPAPGRFGQFVLLDIDEVCCPDE